LIRDFSPHSRALALVVFVAGATVLAGQWAAQPRMSRDPATASAPASVRPASPRGKASLAEGDFQAGFEAYRRAVEYTPNAETHGLVGDLYLRAAVTSEAAFHLRRAADLDPNNADRWLALANVYILKTDLGAAWKAIDRAKDAEPGLIVERDENNFFVRGHAG
jgi:Flp pilus assembly protein TadD